MEKKELLYEGKSKQVYSVDDKDKIIFYFKDDTTAFNGIKKARISNKGILNNKISEYIYKELEKEGIPTHFIKRLNDREQLCEKVNIIPIEVIIRNIVAGSITKRLGIKEGTNPHTTIHELCYKNDALGDPIVNEDHIVALNIATYDELKIMRSLSEKINEILKKLFDERNIILVDFKIEFGRTKDGRIILADEITPDTSRLWDKETNTKLDKDRFRKDLGSVEQAYVEILNRLTSKQEN